MSNSPVTTPSDEDLACRAQQGCAASFEQLVHRFQVPLLHFLRHRGAGAEAEDLLQDTFVRAYTNLHRYRSRWRFATWLFTIARRIHINHYRRLRATGDDAALAAVAARTPGPEQEVAEAEERDRLWQLARRILTEEEQTAVWLYYVEELPVREVAEVVERSWVAVKTALFRARRRLLEVLQEQERTAATRPASNRKHLTGLLVP